MAYPGFPGRFHGRCAVSCGFHILTVAAGKVVTLWALLTACGGDEWCSWKLVLHRVLHVLRDSDCHDLVVVGLRFFLECMRVK